MHVASRSPSAVSVSKHPPGEIDPVVPPPLADAVILCAGYKGAFALDDAYCAGRIVQLLGAEPSDSAKAADAIARAWPDAHDGLLARTYGPPGLEEDIAFCAQVGVLDIVPRLRRMVDGAAEITTD